MPSILVTGSNGQLGSELQKISKNYPQFDFVFADRVMMPLEDEAAINSFLDKTVPDIIISAGAYTAVDKAESEKELANKVNNLALDTISTWCAKNNSKLIHISTDYVFDGSSNTPIEESAATAPINWYGETKLKGEKAIQQNLPEAIIIRTAWVYSEYGNNFVKTMIRLMTERDSLNVVNDQIGSPTYALDLAKAIMNIAITEKWQGGIYHYSNEGEISWFEFATAIRDLSNLECNVEAVSSSQFPTVAKRPSYSLLNTSKIIKTYNLNIPFWKKSLEECLRILKGD